MIVRTATAAVCLPILLGAVCLGGPWLAALVIGAAGVATLEYCKMAREQGANPINAVSATLAVILSTRAYLSPEALGVIVIALFISGVWLMIRFDRHSPMLDLGHTLGGAIYVGWLLSYGPLLRLADGNGREWLLLALLVTFVSDTCALLVGRVFGRHRMAMVISPGKTWEGSIGALIASVIATFTFVNLFELNIDSAAMVILGVLLGVVGQIGDLTESMFKRTSNLKDSGWVMPGHGGMLDRLDSLMFNLPVVYYFSIWM